MNRWGSVEEVSLQKVNVKTQSSIFTLLFPIDRSCLFFQKDLLRHHPRGSHKSKRKAPDDKKIVKPTWTWYDIAKPPIPDRVWLFENYEQRQGQLGQPSPYHPWSVHLQHQVVKGISSSPNYSDHLEIISIRHNGPRSQISSHCSLKTIWVRFQVTNLGHSLQYW